MAFTLIPVALVNSSSVAEYRPGSLLHGVLDLAAKAQVAQPLVAADQWSESWYPRLRAITGQTNASLCRLLLLICYALRSGSLFLASEWRPSS